MQEKAKAATIAFSLKMMMNIVEEDDNDLFFEEDKFLVKKVEFVKG